PARAEGGTPPLPLDGVGASERSDASPATPRSAAPAKPPAAVTAASGSGAPVLPARVRTLPPTGRTPDSPSAGRRFSCPGPGPDRLSGRTAPTGRRLRGTAERPQGNGTIGRERSAPPGLRPVGRCPGARAPPRPAARRPQQGAAAVRAGRERARR